MDWHALFRFDQPLELVVRGTAVYWFLFLLFRLVLRRDVGALGLADVLVVVLMADAIQNGMASEAIAMNAMMAPKAINASKAQLVKL